MCLSRCVHPVFGQVQLREAQLGEAQNMIIAHEVSDSHLGRNWSGGLGGLGGRGWWAGWVGGWEGGRALYLVLLVLFSIITNYTILLLYYCYIKENSKNN